MQKILGIVVYSHPSNESKKPEWCRIKPIYREVEGIWESIEEREADFPSEGLLFWYNPPFDAEKDTCWVATVKKIRLSQEGKEKKDQFGVDSADRLNQFVRLRGNQSHSEIRRLLALGGLTLSFQPVGKIFVELTGEGANWVGPYSPEFRKNSFDRFESGPTLDKAFLPVRSVDSYLLQNVTIEGNSVLTLRPNATIGIATEWFSTQSDSQLLESMLKKLRKFDSAAANSIGVTKNVFKSYVAALEGASLTDVQRLDEEARAEALDALFEELEKSEKYISRTIESIIGHPLIANKLKSEIDKLVEEQKPEVESRILKSISGTESKLEKKKDELQKLESSLIETERELKTKKRLIKTEEQKNRKLLSQFENDLDKVISKIQAKPVLELGRNVVFRALTKGKSSDRPEPAPLSLSSMGAELETLEDVTGALSVAAASQGLDPNVLLSAFTGFLSGKQLVAIGKNSETVLCLISNILAGGRSAQIIIPTNIFGLDDLFDLPVSPIGSSDFEPTKLIDFVKSAEADSNAYALCFKGVNRAPLETAFMDLAFSVCQKGQSILPLRNSRGEATKVEIGAKTVLLSTLATGPTVFKANENFWADTVFIDSARLTENIMSIPEITASVSLASLQTWQKEVESVDNANLSVLVETFGDESSISDDLAFQFHVFKKFGGRDVALAEWMYSRKAATHSQSLLLELAEKFSEGAKQQLEKIIETGGFERVRLAKGAE